MNRLLTACLILGLGLGLTTYSIAGGKKSRTAAPLLSGDLLKVYKAGKIDEAIKKANALNLNDIMLTLAEFKDAYSKALDSSKSIGRSKTTLILFEKAVSLDRKLSGGSGKFHKAIRKKLSKVHFVMGVDAHMSRNYPRAYQSYRSALSYGNSRARRRLKDLEKKAKSLYEEAYVVKSTSRKEAIMRLNLVTNMISSEHVYYTKAERLKANLEKGSQPKEKKEPSTAGEPKPKNTSEKVKICNDLFRNNKKQEVLECFKEVLKLKPKNCDALIGVGICYVTAGEGETAAKFYELFVKHCPRDMRAPQVRKSLHQFKKYNIKR
ncbi:MAG: hypothetical protein JRJ87_04225 [Deltaproteobacteria bacterium]|nr:hypothetical protein [Deltaproteobacteria bacterium]